MANKRLQVKTLFDMGGMPVPTPQAGLNVTGVQPPARDTTPTQMEQFGKMLEMGSKQAAERFRSLTGTEQKTGMAEGKAIAERIFLQRKDMAEGLREAERQGYLHNGRNPFVKKATMIRTGQLFGGSREFLGMMEDGMEDFITEQLSTDGDFDNFEAALNARMGQAFQKAIDMLPDSNAARSIGFTDTAAPVMAAVGKKWAGYYKEAVSIKNEELNANRLQQFYKDGKYGDAVYWHSTGVNLVEVPEVYDEHGIHVETTRQETYKEVIPPYNTYRPHIKPKMFLYDSMVNHVFGDVVKPSNSIGYAQSLRKALNIVTGFRGIKEPNSKTRLDAGEMGKHYGDLTQNLTGLLVAAESGEGRKIKAAQEKTHIYIKNLAIAHFLRNAEGLDVNKDMSEPERDANAGLKRFMSDPAKHFRVFMERLRMGDAHPEGALRDSKGDVIQFIPRGQEGAHPLYAPDLDVFEYMSDQRMDVPGMQASITEIERQLKNQRTNLSDLESINKAAFAGDKAKFANKVFKSQLNYIKKLKKEKHKEIDPQTGKFKTEIRDIGWDDTWINRHMTELTALQTRHNTLFDYEMDLFSLVNDIRGLLNTNFKDSRVERPAPNVAEVYRRIFATSGPRKGMLKWLIDGGQARQRQVFGSDTYDHGELRGIPGWNLSEEFQTRLISMLEKKAEDVSDLLTFDKGTTANQHTRDLVSRLQPLQPDLGPFLMSQFAPQFNMKIVNLYERNKFHNVMSLLAIRFMETDYIPLVEELLKIHNYDMTKVKTDLHRKGGPLWSNSSNPIDIKDENGRVIHTFPQSLLYKFHLMGYDSDFDKGQPGVANPDPNDYIGGYHERLVRITKDAAGLTKLNPNHPRTLAGRPGQ